MIRRALALALATTLALVACDRGGGDARPTPAPSASAAAVASAAPAPSAAPDASARWVGAYTAKPGAVAPPSNAREKTWTKDPGTASVGPGTIELTVGPLPRGEVVGRASGALGDLELSGAFDGKELRATARPREPNAPDAMTGTLSLAVEGDALAGTLRASGRDATIVRDADVKLQKK